jgi:hypothetical protein
VYLYLHNYKVTKVAEGSDTFAALSDSFGWSNLYLDPPWLSSEDSNSTELEAISPSSRTLKELASNASDDSAASNQCNATTKKKMKVDDRKKHLKKILALWQGLAIPIVQLPSHCSYCFA